MSINLLDTIMLRSRASLDALSELLHNLPRSEDPMQDTAQKGLALLELLRKDIGTLSNQFANHNGQSSHAGESKASLPEENPNPVLRISQAGEVIYANPACRMIFSEAGAADISRLPGLLFQEAVAALGTGQKRTIDVPVGERIFSFTVVPVIDQQYVNFYGSDVTERRQLEDENRAQRNLLDAVIQQMPAGVLIADAHSSRLIMSNQQVRAIFRQQDSDQGGNETGASQSFHMDGRPYQPEEWPLHRSIQDGEIVRDEEVRIQRGDGESAYISVSSAPIYETSGEIVAGVAVFFDITERKQAEENTRFLAQFGERLLEINDPDEIVRYSTWTLGEYLNADRCMIDEINLQAGQLSIRSDFYRHPPSLVGKHPISGMNPMLLDSLHRSQPLIIPDVSLDPRTAAIYQTAFEPLGIRSFASVPRLKDNEWRATLSVTDTRPREWRPGEIALLRSVGDLIWLALEAAQLLQNLEQTTERFHVALKNAPVAVYTLDRDLRFTWVYKPLLNMPGEQMLGKRDDELLPPEEVADLVALKRKVIQTGESARTELRLRLDGKERIFDITLEPMRDLTGHVSGLTVAWIEITGQRLLEIETRERAAQIEIQHQILAHREMERQEIARDLHDGPLQELIGLNYAISELSMLDDPAAIQEKIQELQETLQGQIRDVRAFCNELRPPALAPFGVEKAIQAYLEGFREKHPEITVRAYLDSDGKSLPEDTRLALFRVFQEGLNNITRHAEATQLWVNFSLHPDQIMLELRDNGKGFPVPSDWVKLARQGHLGLVGMHERVEALGGKLEVQSAAGKGTRIRVLLPVQEQKQI